MRRPTATAWSQGMRAGSDVHPPLQPRPLCLGGVVPGGLPAMAPNGIGFDGMQSMARQQRVGIGEVECALFPAIG